jgi:hypothetical protein
MCASGQQVCCVWLFIFAGTYHMYRCAAYQYFLLADIMTSVRLLGPDLPTPLTIAVETNQTIAQLKELALTALRPIRTEAGVVTHCAANTYSGSSEQRCPYACLWPAARECRPCLRKPPHVLTAYLPHAGADVPVVGQLKIIHQGRFPPDDKTLKGATPLNPNALRAASAGQKGMPSPACATPSSLTLAASSALPCVHRLQGHGGRHDCDASDHQNHGVKTGRDAALERRQGAKVRLRRVLRGRTLTMIWGVGPFTHSTHKKAVCRVRGVCPRDD